MLYFIPAWYKQNMWCENEQQWYMRRLKSEFDETIKQITLFIEMWTGLTGFSCSVTRQISGISYTGRACTVRSTGHALMR